ncbi:unnamed protein product [Symbiodinium sp. CCMP2456]|nr:unnamed protein product [Symbiodinium sp. CCMP2456]
MAQDFREMLEALGETGRDVEARGWKLPSAGILIDNGPTLRWESGHFKACPAATVEQCQVVLRCPDERTFVDQCRKGAESPIKTLLFGNLDLRGSRHLLSLALQVLPGASGSEEGEEGQREGARDCSWDFRKLQDFKPSATQLCVVGLSAAAALAVGGVWAYAAASSLKMSATGFAVLPFVGPEEDEGPPDEVAAEEERVWMGYGDLAWHRGPRRVPVRPLRRCTWHWDRHSSWARPASLEELRRCLAHKTWAVRRQALRRSPRYRLRQQRWTPLLVAVSPRKDKLQRAPAVLALSSRKANGTAALANFRRSLIGEGWSELARAFVQGPETLAGSHLGRHRRSWTLLLRSGGPLSEMSAGTQGSFGALLTMLGSAKDWLGFDWLGFKEDKSPVVQMSVTVTQRVILVCRQVFPMWVQSRVRPFLRSYVCIMDADGSVRKQGKCNFKKPQISTQCLPESFDDYLAHEVPCFVRPTPGHNWSPSDTLSHALRVLLPALRWMDLLDSGWPFFRLVARISAQVCEQKLGRCPATCDTEDMKVLAETLEEKMFEGPREQGPRDRSDLLEAARAVWRSDAKEVQDSLGRCGEVALAEAAAVRAATYAHTESLQDVLTGIQLTELVVGDLARRTPCALTELSRNPDFWKSMGFVETWLGGHVRYKHRPACKLHFCPDGSPSMRSCRCETSAAPPSANPADPRSVCLITGDPGDDRPLESDLSLLVGTHPEPPNFWSLTYHLNRLYALRHGYRFSRVEVSNDEMERMRADGVLPERKVQWLIVRLISTRLQDRSCELVAWMDSDAFIVSSEPLEELLEGQGFPANHSRPPFFFFASTSATKEIGKLSIKRINISDHFMVVRNGPVSRKMMQEWWRLPLQHSDLSRFRSELFLEQTVMNEYFPRHPKLMAKVPSIELFEGFGGLFVRHMGGIKDMLYRITLRDALVARVLSPLTAPGSGWAQALRQDPVARQLLQLAVDAGWCSRYDCNDES